MFHKQAEVRRPAQGVVGVHLEDVADLRAGEAFIDPVRDTAGPHLVDEVIGDETFSGLPVTAAVHIERHDVTVAGWTTDLGEQGELLAHPVDLRVDVGLGDERGRHRDDEPLVARDRHLGPHLDDGVERNGPGLLSGGDVDLRRGDHVELGLFHRLAVQAWQDVAERLLADRLRPETGLEQSTGDPARPKPRDARLV